MSDTSLRATNAHTNAEWAANDKNNEHFSDDDNTVADEEKT